MQPVEVTITKNMTLARYNKKYDPCSWSPHESSCAYLVVVLHERMYNVLSLKNVDFCSYSGIADGCSICIWKLKLVYSLCVDEGSLM